MKYILGLMMLVSTSAFAASGSGNVSSVYGMCGFAQDSTNIITSATPNSSGGGGGSFVTIPESSINSAGYFTLTADLRSNAGTGSSYSGFYTPGSSTQYSVTSGKTFYIQCVCMKTNTNYPISALLSTSTANFSNGSSTPTGFISGSGYGLYLPGAAGTNTIGQTSCESFPTKIAASLYPTVFGPVGTGFVYLIGKEQ